MDDAGIGDGEHQRILVRFIISSGVLAIIILLYSPRSKLPGR